LRLRAPSSWNREPEGAPPLETLDKNVGEPQVWVPGVEELLSSSLTDDEERTTSFHLNGGEHSFMRSSTTMSENLPIGLESRGHEFTHSRSTLELDLELPVQH